MGQQKLILRHLNQKVMTFKDQASTKQLTHHYQAYKSRGLIKLICCKQVSNFNLIYKSLFVYIKMATVNS
jgi:hypothetical protein